MAAAVGIALQPDRAFAALVETRLGGLIDYVEIAPETTWRPGAGGALVPNGYAALFADVIAELGVFAVAHGVGLSLGGASDESARQRAWLSRARADQAAFGWRWYSEHLGTTTLAGHHVALPLPIPMTRASARLVRARLAAMRSVVADVAVENSAFYYGYGDPLAEADFLAEVAGDEYFLVLDLHNLYTLAVNTGVDVDAYLARLPLDRVIELHASGGSESDPRWLGGEAMRLDSHDDAVPEPVWALIERVAPACPGLRGITLERMEGTLGSGDDEVLADELMRIRAIAEACVRPRASVAGSPDADTLAPRVPWLDPDTAAANHSFASNTSDPLAALDPLASLDPREAAGCRAFESRVARALTAPDASDPTGKPDHRDAARAIAAIADDDALPAELRAAAAHAARSPRGVAVTALLVARLRFERLVQGDPDAARWFERDPAGFAAAFRAYHRQVPATARFPADEATAFARWRTATPTLDRNHNQHK